MMNMPVEQLDLLVDIMKALIEDRKYHVACTHHHEHMEHNRFVHGDAMHAEKHEKEKMKHIEECNKHTKTIENIKEIVFDNLKNMGIPLPR